MRRSYGLVFSLAAMLAATAGHAETISCELGTKPMLVAELFFGRSMDHGRVSERAWEMFVRDTMAPALPGFTVLDAAGGWRDPETHRVIREPTKYVIVALDDTPASHEALRHVTETYSQRFHQRSVGLLLDRRCGKF